MSPNPAEQTGPVVIGVDVGGTFTDLVSFDTATGDVRVVKIPSTPPRFHEAVLEAVQRAAAMTTRADPPVDVIHGSTVATNALLQRTGEPVAFVTTEGFRDLLLIGRQNRPKLYALRVVRPTPITPEKTWLVVRERVGAAGDVVTALVPGEIDRVVREVKARGLRHAAVCLLFSFVNPDHERRLGAALEAAGVTVSLSSDVLPEFREYERASTTAINAAVRPTVRQYLTELDQGLGARSLRIMHSGGGTLGVDEAAKSAAKLVLSGPAGGVIGATFVAAAAGLRNLITYDMGGTSTDVAVVPDGNPQWSNGGVVDGLPIGLPAFDIHTVGAGGGSIAAVDTGGALRVGPTSAGANPGPACYGRGGLDPTVTDANLVLGRLLGDQFLGGGMALELDRAVAAIQPLAKRTGSSLNQTALGVVRIAEANMATAVRAVTSRRGHDPRQFALVSFGGAGGLHACAVAESLDIPTVLIPPYCGVLSALGMVVAKPVVDVARTVVHLAMTDAILAETFAAMEASGFAGLPVLERFADVRFRGQSFEIKVPVPRATTADIEADFRRAYLYLYGTLPQGRTVEVVTLRVRGTGTGVDLKLPEILPAPAERREASVVAASGRTETATVVSRGGLLAAGTLSGPILLIDPTATAYIPPEWSARARRDGSVLCSIRGRSG